ncbi:MAG: bifunctional salicylyl-CoA 5-hydroxylase/oxidoreductase [Polyangiaceae bacterium]|nr:bifunctional salicylyl-CoA 5-hydroxylase/oxidoreductase [Polyangiaceae bacterium]
MGGGPAGLYFAILMKKARPDARIVVHERNRSGDTFGFGVVFSDATLDRLKNADAPTFEAITSRFYHWDDIDIYYGGQVIRSTGHGFAGLSRQALLDVLEKRALELGVEIKFESEVKTIKSVGEADLILVVDGVNSIIRAELAAEFKPSIDFRPNRFVWLGTTKPFEAFTFYFNENQHGLFQVHAYRYEPGRSTFIVECSEKAFLAAGLDKASEDETITYFEKLFEKELDGHKLLKNRSIWRAFPVIRNEKWHTANAVLMGDAAHTAHYSIGSGTKLAMEDAIDLCEAVLKHPNIEDALAAYEATRRPGVESLQRSAQVSLEWFESTPRYMKMDPLSFAMSLLTRSLRITHENLKLRDPALIKRVDEAYSKAAFAAAGRTEKEPAPPMFTPYRLRDMVLENRVVVSPMCQYSADEGAINDWHLVHLGSRAVGGAGLVITEMTDVSADGRITPGCAGMYNDAHVSGWKRITRFVHQHSFAKIALQIAHAGRKGATKRMWEGMDQPLESGGWPLLSASAIPYLPNSAVPKAMDRADMDRVKADFVKAAGMANDAEFDMIELHFAHGYLLASFLSPLTNQRSDNYGGNLANRLRYPIEVLSAVRNAWPTSRPISVRISATDWDALGTSADDAVIIAKALKENGADIIDVSAGQTVSWGKPAFGRLYQVPFSDRIRHEANVPTMAVGAISSYADVNSILSAGRADLCVLARAHLFDPYWTQHAAQKQGVRLPWQPQYGVLDGYSARFE